MEAGRSIRGASTQLLERAEIPWNQARGGGNLQTLETTFTLTGGKLTALAALHLVNFRVSSAISQNPNKWRHLCLCDGSKSDFHTSVTSFSFLICCDTSECEANELVVWKEHHHKRLASAPVTGPSEVPQRSPRGPRASTVTDVKCLLSFGVRR